MAQILKYTLPIASGGSHTAGVDLGNGEYNRFAVVFPASTQAKFTAALTYVKPQMSLDEGTTWVDIGYSNNPSTATTSFALADFPVSSVVGGSVICEAALFATYFRVAFSTATTAAGDIYVMAGKD
jgi:hypothetical protein